MAAPAPSSLSYSSPWSIGAEGAALWSIPTICEALWTCRDPEQAIVWVERLSQTLAAQDTIQASHSDRSADRSGLLPLTFDYSDTFLAIQGVALKFRSIPTAPMPAAGDSNSPDSARNPADHRLAELALSATAALAHFHVGPTWHRQRRRAAPQTPIGTPHSVPEGLPAAMLRFAAAMGPREHPWPASALGLQSQARLVASLCGPPHWSDTMEDSNNEYSFTDGSDTWSLPGVQAPLRAMVASWLDAVGARDSPWMLRWELLHTIQQLIRSEWRPPSRSSSPAAVDRVIEAMIRMAEECLDLVWNTTSSSSPQAWPETLQPVSRGAAQAMTGLSLLASRRWVPLSLVPQVVGSACDMHGRAQTLARQHRGINPTDTGMDLVVMELEDLVWFLLATTEDAFADVGVGVLMTLVEQGNPTVQATLSIQDKVMACRRAGSAIQLLSCAFWVTTGGGQSLLLLRVYWLPFLKLILRMLEDLYRTLDECSDPAMSSSLASVVTEIFLSLCRVMENEQTNDSSGCQMTAVEWEIQIDRLEQTLVPWLCLGNMVAASCQEAARLFVTQLCRSIEYWTLFRNVPFAEYDTLERLYLGLVRSIVPIIPSNEAEHVALAVFESWAKYGLFPYRLEAWAETASLLLGEAFRFYSRGNFIHKPSVRLKALTLMTDDKEDPNGMPGTTSLGAAPSLLVLTQHTRETYLDYIAIVLPMLRLVIQSPEIVDSGMGVSHLAPLSSNEPHIIKFAQQLGERFEDSSPITRYSGLAYYAVQLMGKLFHAPSGHRDHRNFLVDLLRVVALSETDHRIALRIRFAAIVELDKCLTGIFTTLSYAHACVPSIISALCDIFKKYASDCIHSSDEATTSSALVLALCSLDPLTRVRVAIDNHAAFRPVDASFNVPAQVLQRLFHSATPAYRSAVVETFGVTSVEIASELGQTSSNSMKTVLSMECIIDSATLYLQQRKNIESSDVANAFGLVCMRIHCFDVLRHQFLAASPSRIDDITARSIFSLDSNAELIEIQAQALALTHYAENAFLDLSSNTIHDHHLDQDFEHIMKLILQLLESQEASVRALGFNCSSVFLAPLTKTAEISVLGNFTLASVYTSLRNLGRCGDHANAVPEVLAIIFELILSPSLFLPKDIRILFFKTFLCHADATQWSPDSYSNLLGLYGAASLVETLEYDSLQEARSILMDLQPDDICVEALNGLFQAFHFTGHDPLNKASSDMHLSHRRFNDLAEQDKLVRQFECNQSSSNNCAAWLLDDCLLLTLRVGASNSRYAGHVEIIVRSQGARERAVVSIPDQSLVRDPDFFSIAIEAKTKKCTEGEGGNVYCIPDRTKNVIDRFEALLGATGAADIEASSSYQDVLHKYEALMERANTFQIIESDKENDSTSDVTGLEEWLQQLTSNPKDSSFVRSSLAALLYRCGIFDVDEILHRTVSRRLVYEEGLHRAIAVLDLAPVMNTHKIALLYDRSAEQSSIASELGARLLSTTTCSPAFHKLIARLGSVVPTKSLKFFSGGLDTSDFETDGKFALMWTNMEETQSLVASTVIVYHAASLMPSHGIGNVVNRKRHVGNDFVVICFADRGSDAIVQYDLLGGELIGGAFGLVIIFVTIHKAGTYRVNVRVRNIPTNDHLNQTLERFVSDYSVSEDDGPALIRNIALRADLACRAATGSPDALPNFVYRRQVIRNMKRYIANVPSDS